MKAASFWKISVLVPSMIAISGVAIVWHAYKIRSNNLQLAEQARTLRIRAGQGDPQAQYALGLLYYQGKGTPRDYAEALQWYRKAAAQSDAKTQEALGSMYYYGRGVQQDSAEAARWYRLAANQGQRVPSSILATCTTTAKEYRRIAPRQFAGIRKRPIRETNTLSVPSA